MVRPAFRSSSEPRLETTVFSDLSERIHYNLPSLPIYAYHEPLSGFAGYRCPCHWHRDLEFVHVISGRMHYFVNGTVTVMEAGDGILVNSSRLHYGFSPERREAWFSCAVISPTLFESATPSVAARCAQAFAQDMPDLLTLSPHVDWQRDMLDAVDRVVRLMPDDPQGNPLPTLAAAIDVCDMAIGRLLSEGVRADARDTAAGLDAGAAADVGADASAQASTEQRDRMDVLLMTGMIQQRFREPLTLAGIAAAAHVSRTQCCLLFRRYVGRTPVEYLTERRLEEAKRQLDGTARAIAEIAADCGFSSPSYFASVFRRHVGVTPREFRERR